MRRVLPVLTVIKSMLLTYLATRTARPLTSLNKQEGWSLQIRSYGATFHLGAESLLCVGTASITHANHLGEIEGSAG